MAKRRDPIIQDDTPEVPDPEREALRGLDDATVAHMPSQAAKAEIASRRRFEAQWSGAWTSGPRSKVARPSMDAERQKRRAFRELLAMAHSSNKAARASARFLLKRDHGHSVS
jgi:hypothetical protein